MEGADGVPRTRAGRLLRGLSATGAVVTGVLAWLGCVATLFAHPPMVAAVFLAAAAIAFGLLAIAAHRN